MLENATNFFAATPFAKAMREHPLICLDVGSRGGFEPDLLPLAFAVEAHGLEPDPLAFAAIKGESGPWRAIVHHPVAISGTGGPRTLFVTEDPAGSSLLPFSQAMAERYHCPQYRTVSETVPLETMTLPDLIVSSGMNRLDYLKLDVEGAEFEILNGASAILPHVAMAKVEVSFGPFRDGQGQAADVAKLMIEAGFFLLDMIRPAHWRTMSAPPHPSVGSDGRPYSRGRLIQTDYLFLREPATVDDPSVALRTAFLALGHGYFDEAAIFLRRPEVMALLGGLDLDAALDEVSRAYGRRARAQALKCGLRRLMSIMRNMLR